jgi:hypothetical protein
MYYSYVEIEYVARSFSLARMDLALKLLSPTPMTCNIVVPTVQELSKCETAQEVLSISVPGEIGMVGFKGSENFIPGPVLRNTIVMLNTRFLLSWSHSQQGQQEILT